MSPPASSARLKSRWRRTVALDLRATERPRTAARRRARANPPPHGRWTATAVDALDIFSRPRRSRLLKDHFKLLMPWMAAGWPAGRSRPSAPPERVLASTCKRDAAFGPGPPFDRRPTWYDRSGSMAAGRRFDAQPGTGGADLLPPTCQLAPRLHAARRARCQTETGMGGRLLRRAAAASPRWTGAEIEAAPGRRGVAFKGRHHRARQAAPGAGAACSTSNGCCRASPSGTANPRDLLSPRAAHSRSGAGAEARCWPAPPRRASVQAALTSPGRTSSDVRDCHPDRHRRRAAGER